MTDLMNEILDLHAIAGLDSPSIPLNAARMSLFDWMVCGRAGTREPVAEKNARVHDRTSWRGCRICFWVWHGTTTNGCAG